jgi:hypothetical protein
MTLSQKTITNTETGQRVVEIYESDELLCRMWREHGRFFLEVTDVGPALWKVAVDLFNFHVSAHSI